MMILGGGKEQATVTKHFSARLGSDFWAVTWGKGMTETAICMTQAEAVSLAFEGRRKGVESLVSFRNW